MWYQWHLSNAAAILLKEMLLNKDKENGESFMRSSKGIWSTTQLCLAFAWFLCSQSCLVSAIVSDFEILTSHYFTSSPSMLCISLYDFYPALCYWEWTYLNVKVISIDFKIYLNPPLPSLALWAPPWFLWFLDSGFFLTPVEPHSSAPRMFANSTGPVEL